MKRIANWLLTMLAIAGPVVFLSLVLSPRLAETMSVATEDLVPVDAQVTSCIPQRNGRRARTEIVCRFDYAYEGTQHNTESTAWSRDDPFLTSTGLTQALAQQSASTTRTAYLRSRTPEEAELADPRWVTVPPLWLWLLALFAASAVLIVRADPSDLPHRRVDLALDPATGHLVPINHHRRDRIRRRLVVQGLAALLAGGICLYGLSNQPANLVAKSAMRALQPVSAQLVDCGHRYRRAGRSGHDSLDCDFVYAVAGQTYRGKAESLRFGLFPTDARMDAKVAALQAAPAVTAYVDPRYPGFAWAFLSEDVFIPFTWGLFELQLVLLMLVAGGVLVAAVVRWRRAQ
jgi:hypothetical protein